VARSLAQFKTSIWLNRPAANAWLHVNTAEESTRSGETLVIEVRCFAELADAIIAAGLLFERNALPN